MTDEHHEDPSHGISIWFFIGALLAVYGVIIVVANVLPSAAAARVALGGLHAGIWWGALLFALGVMYVIVFRPGRR